MGNNTRQRTNSNNQHTRKDFQKLQQAHKDQKKPVQEVIDEHGIPYVTDKASQNTQPFVPSAFTAFRSLFVIVVIGRLCSIYWGTVGDCDEVYNYWEPFHFTIYGKGFQTWEYDPKYGLRSYAYILLHVVPSWIYAQVLEPNPVYVYFVTRALLALICAGCETYFYIGVSKEIGANVGRITLGLLICSAGMFVSGTTFLPSTTSMYLAMLSHGAWFQQSYALAIFATALSTYISWPFAALLGLPIACDIVLRLNKVGFFLKWSMISTVAILIPQILIDSHYYGKLVIAPFNIVKYNVFSSHGPDLFGTEPWTYYLLNGLVNFNISWILALLVWPLQAFMTLTVTLPQRSSSFLPVSLSQLAFYLWLSVFWLQPHKEERFLYPIYPLICLAAAISVDTLQKLFYAFCVRIHKKHYLDHTTWLSLGFLTVTCALSASRIVAMYQNYHAPFDIWLRLNNISLTQDFATENRINVCLGKEWYRYPSSFFLPAKKWNVKFLQSEFKGQLPQPFLTDHELATAIERPNFNDLNLEEVSRYVKDPLTECDFIVDFETGASSPLEPIYSQDSQHWKEELSLDFLDASRSHKLFRAFYIPFTRGENVSWGKYVLLRRKVGKRKTRNQV